MDDLSGLDWSKPAAAPPKQQAPIIRPPPNQPLASLQPTAHQPSAASFLPAKAAQQKDSFSNLVSFGTNKASQNLTLAERQAQLEAEKRKRDEERRKLSEAQFGSGQQWDALGSRAFTPSPSLQPPAAAAEEDDLFAAFNKDTKVDNASHYPPPSSERSISSDGRQLDLRDPKAWKPTTAEEDDDPFGLNELKPYTAAPTVATDEDDFLGDLAKPVDEVRRKQQATARPEPGKPIEPDDTSSSEEDVRQTDDALNRAVAQLVDYGFSPADAMRGLKHSGGGSANPQAAANWLLDEAHRKAERKSQGRSASAGPKNEADFTRSAAAVSSSFFKTANSLWKTGQKKMQQAVADFQQEGDTGRPRWMRDAQQEQRASAGDARATDEALALESGGRPPPVHPDRKAMPQHNSGRGTWSTPSSGSQSRSSPAPRWQQQAQPPVMSDARSRLNRLAADDDDIDSFSSHVRRRKPEPQVDLMLGTSEAPKPARAAVAHRPAQAQTHSIGPPKVAPRRVPPIDAAALQASTRHRIQGTAHFKRGDFATAHASYSSSMAGVPATHPLMIVLLTNRALTALKTGEPKQAVSDADEALKLIGPGRGRDETVAVRGEDGQEETKPLTELYGKALSRKAEALEQMEKWADAGAVWHLCVEAGVGGPTAVKGRQRCQEALAPKKKPATTTTKAAVKRPPRSSAPAKTSAAVERLREANQAAAREEDEKFALAEQVDSRISAWRDGKRDNLRALLGSLDKVLWANSGWKAVGMHELVMANRVKVIYMKAIAKTHPDKLPQDASTEVRLVAGLVFSTLNESWDRFKADNGL
ncbi:hypothetical protein CP532_0307 [Ophiocordyceps camponoti-leonardi (nom. inval.)]|nr:hypothetical protein CP532_0307 [Ophiocordyceps camponoti-leonardi (nom. inval.)]